MKNCIICCNDEIEHAMEENPGFKSHHVTEILFRVLDFSHLQV